MAAITAMRRLAGRNFNVLFIHFNAKFMPNCHHYIYYMMKRTYTPAGGQL